MTLFTSIQLTTALLTGLVAGLLYGYDCSVIRGLGNLEDKDYLSAFQSINRAILNPYFFTSFLGSVILLPITTYLSFKGGVNTSFYFLVTATLLYAVGVMGITLFGNVPLNNALDQLDILNASTDDLKMMREKFESFWNILHHWRTYASLLVFVLTTLSLIKK